MRKILTQQFLVKLLLLAVGSFLLYQCQLNEKTNIKTYYFPLHDLYEGLTYEYRAVGNEQLPPYYWYYRTIDQEESTFLTGMYLITILRHSNLFEKNE